MLRQRLPLFALVVLSLTSAPALLRAAPEPVPGDGILDAPALAAKIDQMIAARWAEKQVQPAAHTEDGEFLRRVFLDLAGRIPNILEIRDFLDDDSPDKRQQWVDLLLKGIRKDNQTDTYSDHFAGVWRTWLLATANNEQLGFIGFNLEAWLRDRLKQNTTYDQLVRALVTAQGGRAGNAGFMGAMGNASPAAFSQAYENKPENLAGATARMFLGIKLECAQCHDDRSGGTWVRTQFWEYAAFFAGVGPQGQLTDRREIKIPGTDKLAQARFLTGTEPQWKQGGNPRATLADWLTSPENPYFARAAVNRLWGHFFGTGLTDPVDESGDHNRPSHPELLDLLAKQFAVRNFDLKYLIRAIVGSKTYQLSSEMTHPSQLDPRLFARLAVRGLTAEQLFDSLAEATEYKDGGATMPQRFVGFNNATTPRADFVTRFTNVEKRTESQTSILQALYLMNNKFIADRTSLKSNRTLASIADHARVDTPGRIERLYLVTLCRKPRAEELERLVKYVDKGGADGDKRQALADVFWALLNSAEFLLNH